MLTPFPVEGFGGLNLRDDPEEIGWAGALDMLNIDLDRNGRVRSRDGLTAFTSDTGNWGALATYSTPAGVDQLVAQRLGTGATAKLTVYNTSGVVVSSSATSFASGDTSPRIGVAGIGTPTASYLYFTDSAGNARRWDGTTWTSPVTLNSCMLIAVSPTDNRLVTANVAGGNGNRVFFSDPGAPETFGANNYVDLTPGDGEFIQALVSWRELLFVFKRTKFFVFYGQSTDSSGNPVFNYRTVWQSGIGSTQLSGWPQGAVATRSAVYFIGADGLYRTTGGVPDRVSDPVTGLMPGGVASYFQGAARDRGNLPNGFDALSCAQDRVYWTYKSITNSSRQTLVYDARLDVWLYWDTPLGCVIATFGGFTQGSVRLIAGAVTGSPALYSVTGTTDGGAAITSRYRSGFSDLGAPGREKTVRQTEVKGIGTVSLGWSRDFGAITTSSSANVTLGTSPATARAYHRKAQNGELLGYQLASVSGGAWTVDGLVPEVRAPRLVGEKTT